MDDACPEGPVTEERCEVIQSGKAYDVTALGDTEEGKHQAPHEWRDRERHRQQDGWQQEQVWLDGFSLHIGSNVRIFSLTFNRNKL